MNPTEGALAPQTRDVQASQPETRIALSRVGVTGVEKVIHVAGPGEGAPGETYFAELECFVDLAADQAGVHMSRFEEIVNEAIDEVVLSEAMRAEVLAAHIAERVRERQGGLRAEVNLSARYPETVPAPASGIPTQEIYTLLGTAVASGAGVRTLTGVSAQGMTACPCAQEMVASRARQRLAERGMEPEQIELALEEIPVATHNQRGIGTLQVGVPGGEPAQIDARELLEVVESSMSSEIYELMKRPDEVAVVEKAHMTPRFVEDCVREMVRQVAQRWPELAGGGFISARQENLETIHRHNVVAERHGLVAAVIAEIDGEPPVAQLSARDWLEG